ncbi:hypothetical protein GOBAR_DD24682 [Gossypium barbadense]|nr:hypothetical protein GOBAR_DD24682 [Gossypium barbadense]
MILLKTDTYEPFGPRDIGIFHLKDGSLEKYYQFKSSHKDLPPYIWISLSKDQSYLRPLEDVRKNLVVGEKGRVCGHSFLMVVAMVRRVQGKRNDVAAAADGNMLETPLPSHRTPVNNLYFKYKHNIATSSAELLKLEASPCIDLRQVNSELAVAAKHADWVILEGMGRALHTNFSARFKCEALKNNYQTSPNSISSIKLLVVKVR